MANSAIPSISTKESKLLNLDLIIKQISMSTSVHSRKNLITNFFSLSAVQIAGYVIPLISVPFLLRTIGTEKYGLFSLTGAFAAYIQVLLDYGFNISAIRDVSKNRNSGKKLSFIVSGVMSAKAILLFISIIISVTAILLVPRLHHDFTAYFIISLAAIGTSFLPSWYFQGIEKMKILAVLNLSSKIIYLILIILLIRKPDDFTILLFISVLSTCSIAFVGMIVMIKQVRFKIRLGLGWKVLKSSFGIFTTQFWATVLQISTVFILGFFANNKVVGVYAVAEKIAKAVISMGIPLCSSIFPRSSILFKESSEMAFQFLRKFILMGGIVMAILSITLFTTAPIAAKLILGYSSQEVTLLIRILSILPFTIFIDNIYGTQILFNIGLEKVVIRIITISAIISLVLLVSLTPLFGPVGTALSFLLSEFLILILMGISLWRIGITPILTIKKGVFSIENGTKSN